MVQGKQGQLMVGVNHLQSDKILAGDGKDKQSSRDPITLADTLGYKLPFLTYDGVGDLLSWLNRCDQFFRIQDTPATGKVFLTIFYMASDAAQWYALVECNRGMPTWEEFIKLVNQWFDSPLYGNTLGELIQLRWESSVAD
jgi:hypothetical protein